MIILHTARTPNGRKISIALEELGLDYEVRAVNLEAKEQLEESFLALTVQIHDSKRVLHLETGSDFIFSPRGPRSGEIEAPVAFAG